MTLSSILLTHPRELLLGLRCVGPVEKTAAIEGLPFFEVMELSYQVSQPLVR